MIVVWVAVVVVGGCLAGGLMVGVLMLAAQRTSGDVAVRLAVEARKMAVGYDQSAAPMPVESRRLKALPRGRLYDE